jgi:DNA segregation ATPase FtsK/SpoIIIE-like protein
MKRFCYEHRKEIAAWIALVSVTVLLCVPFTVSYAVKIFGWAVYFYLVLGYVAAILHSSKKSVNLTPKSAVLLILSTVFALSTLHVACVDKSTAGTFTEYIIGAYTKNTVGGVIFGIITSPLVIWLTYVWAVVVYLCATAALSFFFVRPFVFVGAGESVSHKPVKKKSAASAPREIILDESPFLHKTPRAGKPPVAIMTSETGEDAVRELLGGDEDYGKDGFNLSSSDTYEVRYGAGIRPFGAKRESELTEEEAVNALFEKDRYEPDIGAYGKTDDVKEELLFDSERDGGIIDILKPRTDGNSLARALKRKIGGSDTTPTKAEETETAEETEKISATEKYVYVNGAPVRVLSPTDTPAAAPRTAFETKEVPKRSAPEGGAPEAAPRKTAEIAVYPKKQYVFPPKSILQDHINSKFNPQVDNWAELKDIFEERIQNFGIEAKLVDAIKGPTVTICILALGDKCPISKLNTRHEDLQRMLKSTKPVVIIPQIPGTEYCGVQIPNEEKGIVSFKEIFNSREYAEAKGDILVALGKTAEGKVLIEDLASMPHALVAGATGSGKSVCLNVMIASILFRYSPDEVKLILIDLKQVEMSIYAGLPHMLLKEPLSEIPEIVNALKWIREEVVARFTLFKNLHFRNLGEYNAQPNVKKLPRIVIIIDEASELMTDPNAHKALENTLSSLARISRAAGVHLIFATQNPIKTVITNEIQNNLNTKIAFAVGDYNHSMVIFKAKGAECLLGKGDMYIKRGEEMKRAQCAYVDTKELEKAVDFIKTNNDYEFDDAAIQKILNGNADVTDGEEKPRTERAAAEKETADDGADDANAPDLEWQALKLCVDENYVSCSYLQRKLKRGYNTVASILEQLASDGYVTAIPQGSKEKREILISREDFYREWEARFGKADEDYEMENADKNPPAASARNDGNGDEI